MVFSSITFIYFFLPCFLLCYYIVPKKYRNSVLLLFNLLFYFLGDPRYLILLIISCIINYLFSIFISKYKKYSKVLLILAVIYNLFFLIYFKYMNFFLKNISSIFKITIPYMSIIMPIGISFYTFQALGYVIDVYKGDEKPAKNIWTFMMYISLFPQLIAGPIIRYHDIKEELDNRKYSYQGFYSGIERFIIGLSKKVLFANLFGEFSSHLITHTVLSSWLKPIIFTLQIYFDFSGYSDMAIGLGLMMGFHFMENFRYPLIASSITDFWRRWHISLSSWFRDYVYIPLGGNRVSKGKWIRNILIVWALTGLWHGASWNFVCWGLFFAILLIFEKLVLGKLIEKRKILSHIYTLFFIMISFLIFQTEDILSIFSQIKEMFFMTSIPFIDSLTKYYLRSNFILLFLSILFITPYPSIFVKKISKNKFISICLTLFYFLLLIICTAYLIDEAFNPFLYFRF